jgi:tetratricopeptide (TPR) repeat protein
MRPRTNSAHRIAWNAIVRAFVWAVAAAWLVPGSSANGSQGASPPVDARPPEARIRELADRGRAERDQGRIDESIGTLERARAVADATGDYRSVIQLDVEVVVSLSQAGRYEPALEILRRVEVRLEELDQDPDFAAAASIHVRSEISQALQRLGRRHEALEEARSAVRNLDTTRDPAARGDACRAMGGCLMALGRTAEARAWLQRTVEETENLDPADIRRAQARNALALCLGELGEWESALEIAENLVNELESLGSYPALLGSEVFFLRGQLWCYRDWHAAEQDFRRSLALLRAAGADESGIPLQQATLYLAHAVRNAGRPEESATMERRVLADLRDLHPPTEPTAIRAAQFLAASLRDLYERNGDRGLLDESRNLLEVTARHSQEVGDPNSASVFALLGELLLDSFQDPRAAEPWLRAAVDKIESRSSGALVLEESDRAGLLHQLRLNRRYDPYESLLRCLVRLDRPEEALDVLEHSRARSLTDLLERSRLDTLQQALERAEEVGDEASADRMRLLPRKLDAAMALLAGARGSVDSDENRARIREAYEQVRRLQSEQAALTQAITSPGRVAAIEEVRRSLGKDEILLAYFLGRRASYACLAEAAGGRIDWFSLADDDGQALTSEVVEAQSRTWVGALSRGVGDPARGLTPSKSPPERDVSMALTGHRLFRWLVPPELWLRIRGRALVHLLPHGPLNWLPFEALAVEPKGDDGSPVYWLDAGPAIAYQESGSALAWAHKRREAQTVHSDRGLVLIVADPDYGEGHAEPIRPASGPVVVRVQRGGPAAREGLLVGDMIESLAGTKVGSVADCERIRRANPDATDAPLVILRSGVERSYRLPSENWGLEIAPTLPADMQRGSPRSSVASLERLPGTAREAAAVREALAERATSAGKLEDSVRLLTASDATESLLTAWASGASILHIAAHQVPDPAGCSDSGRIALTAPPFPTAEDDGYLDLDDLLIHWRGRLEQCGLVVLSSCWSRTGRLVRDEGFFGLPLGLRFAGCPSIVSSLWPVDDAATAELMSSFYRSMESAHPGSRSVALRDSKRALKRAWPDPYYWAAFVWTGAPR